MTDSSLQIATRDIVVEEEFPHAPETIWKVLTSGALMARWIMAPTGFEAVEGTRFTFQTTPAGDWDGVIQCQVLEVIPHERFVYSWKGGHPDNVGYGARLDTVVTFTLAKMRSGTRLRVVHSGFELPRNEIAFRNMGDGWKKVVSNVGGIADEQN
jgi:uncharacterized protein YndB with AHSA1/START domain